MHRTNEMTGINGPTGIFELITALEIIKFIQKCNDYIRNKCLETEVCVLCLTHPLLPGGDARTSLNSSPYSKSDEIAPAFSISVSYIQNHRLKKPLRGGILQ